MALDSRLGMGADSYYAWTKTQQSDFDTVDTTPDLWFPGHPGGPALTMEPVASGQARGGEAEHYREGDHVVAGPMPMDWYHGGMEALLNSVLSRSIAEVASITISSGVNDDIDFVDSGGTKSATLAAGDYTPTDLATEVASKMTTASSDTISCSFAHGGNDTFTISSDGGTFQLLWNSGANSGTNAAAALGFSAAADDTGATSYESDNALTPVYDHTYVIPTDLAMPFPYGLSGWMHLDNETIRYRAMFVDSLTWQIQNKFVLFTPNVVAAQRTGLSATVSPTFGTDIPALVAGKLTVAITTSSNTHASVPVRGLTITVAAPVDRTPWDGSNYAVAFSRNAKIIPEVTFELDWTGVTTIAEELRDDWTDCARVQSTITLTGESLTSSPNPALSEQTTWSFSDLRGVGADPTIGGPGKIVKPNTFRAQRHHSSGTAAMTITTRSSTYLAAA